MPQRNPWAWRKPYVSQDGAPFVRPPPLDLSGDRGVEPEVDTPVDEDEMAVVEPEDDLVEPLPARFTSHAAAETWLEVNDLQAPEGWVDMTLAQKHAAWQR